MDKPEDNGQQDEFQQLREILEGFKQPSSDIDVPSPFKGAPIETVLEVMKASNELLARFKEMGLDSALNPKASQPEELIQSSDSPTKFAHLGFRFLYTFIAWFVLGKSEAQGEAFFVATFLFVIPLFMDYLKFDAVDRARKIVRRVGIIITAFWVVVAVAGLVGILTVQRTTNSAVAIISKNFVAFPGKSVSLLMIWLSLLSCVAWAAFDWWFYQPPIDSLSVTGGKRFE